MKKVIALLICVLMLGATTVYFSNSNIVNASPMFIENGEIPAYAAALATLDEHKDKSKDEMMTLSAEYLEKRADINHQISDYMKSNSIILTNADRQYEEACKQMGRNYLTPEEYEKLMPEEAKRVIKERNAYVEEADKRQQELDREYNIEKLPVLYYSIEELKSGLEESLWILEEYDSMMDGKKEPEAKGYSKEDFYRLLEERVQAEKSVLNKLNEDKEPDLYDYCLMVYQEREKHPVIY